MLGRISKIHDDPQAVKLISWPIFEARTKKKKMQRGTATSLTSGGRSVGKFACGLRPRSLFCFVFGYRYSNWLRQQEDVRYVDSMSEYSPSPP
jgi:hypothetical protein